MSDSINALIAGQHNASVIDSLANPPQVNVLGSITRASEAAQGVMRMRALQSQQAWGEALQQATGSDGTVNYPLATSIAAGRPDAAMGMAAGLEGASGRMNEQVSRGHMLLGMMHGAVGALDETTTPPAQLRTQLNATFDRLEAAGAPNVAQERALIPKNDADLPTFIQQLRRSGDAAVSQTGLLYGTTGQVSTGGASVPYVQAPASRGGVVTAAPGAIQMGLTPQEATEIVQVPERDAQGVPTGKTIPMAKGELYDMLKIPWRGGGAAGPAATPAKPNKPAPAAAPAVTPAAAPASAATALPGWRADLTISPDEKFRLDQAGGQFQKEGDAGAAAVQQSALLGNMLADLAGFTPGKGADWLQQLQSRAQYWAPGLAKSLNIEPGALSAKEGFDKFAAQIANAQGAQSDKRLAVVEAGTPHSEMTPAGVDKIMRQLQGNSDYMQYRAKAAANYPKQYDYRRFQIEMQDLDPRVFQMARMTDPQRKEYWTQLDSAAKTEVGNAIRKKVEFDKRLTGK
jgi:hypothetical protein